MRLSKIVEAVQGKVLTDSEWDREIYSLSVDSRKCGKGGLFICLKGNNSDSHLYAAEAVKNGAVAVLTERKLVLNVPQILVQDTRLALSYTASLFYGEPSKKLKIIGITGTNGKTTVSYMLSSILQAAGKKVGVIGTLGIRYGRTEIPSMLTTPDPIELNKTLAEMLLYGTEYVVMEVSAHALYYKKTAGIVFSACIFTNLTQDHLDFFENMDAYKNAKSRLFTESICPLAVLNGDDSTGRCFGGMREERKGKTVFYGLNTPSDAFAVITDEGLKSSSFMLNLNDQLCRVDLRLTGRHNVYNALAAATCARELGVGIFDIAKGLESLKEVKGRLQAVANYQGAEIYVDFAHTPDGLQKSLSSLRQYCKGRLICLFGCGGNRDKSKRAIMGETAAKTADFCILTSDNPRYEDPLDIISEIERGYRRFSVRYVVVPDRKRAIDYGLDFLKKDDVFLIAGKGGEEYQEIMGIKYPFNDQDIIEKLIKRKGESDFFKT